jgi:hypothetical protein
MANEGCGNPTAHVINSGAQDHRGERERRPRKSLP